VTAALLKKAGISPALLISTSRRPKSAMIAATTDWTADLSVTSSA